MTSNEPVARGVSVFGRESSNLSSSSLEVEYPDITVGSMQGLSLSMLSGVRLFTEEVDSDSSTLNTGGGSTLTGSACLCF